MVALVQVQRCSLELTLHSLLHAAVGLSEHGPKEFLSDSNIMVVYLEHMASAYQLFVHTQQCGVRCDIGHRAHGM